MSAKLRKIGVLGGMGPEATVLFMQRVIAATPATDDCDHIPMLVDNDTQVPSRIRALIEGGGDDPAPALAQMAAGLEQAGARALVMPCNTAHNYAKTIRNAVSIPFLSMIELTAQVLAEKTGPKALIGMLGSPALRITGIFDDALKKRQLRPIYSAEEKAMLTAIRALKASSSTQSALDIVLASAQEMILRGADILLVGCTEFSLIKAEIEALHPTIDSLDILVAETIRFSRHGAISEETGRKSKEG